MSECVSVDLDGVLLVEARLDSVAPDLLELVLVQGLGFRV